jgi:hypothetical protein
MRKVLLAVGAALLAVGPVAARPALAQENAAYVTWQSPDEGARLSGQTVHIKAKAGFYGGVKSWAVEVLAPQDADYPGYGTVCEQSESRSPAYVNIDCVWDTTAYPNDGGPSQNRPYKVRITTQGSAQSGTISNGREPAPHSEERDVTVSNPVSPPRDVRLGFVDSTRQATVRWQPNPEPDIVSYVVQERVGDGPWKNVGQAGGKVTSFTRSLSAPGTYRYQVAALRAAGSDNDTIQSAWSGPSAEPKQIVVAEPKRPETTTTTAPPDAADGSADPPPPADPGDPTVPPAPAPVASAGAVNDPAAPGAPAPDGSTDTSRSGAALISPIQHGAPGSVRSGGATVGGLAAPPSTKPPKAPKEELDESEGPDTGFSSQLPYKQAGEAAEGGDRNVGRMLVGLPEAIGGDETRQVLVPLAGGLLLFVFAMHALYISRRAAPEAPLDTD